MDIQFGYTTVVRLLFSQWNLARSQFLARRGTIFDFERVEIGNLYTFLFFRSSRLINSKEFIFHFNYTSFYYWLIRLSKAMRLLRNAMDHESWKII